MKQSSIRCRGARSFQTMGSILSVQNKNFSGDGKELTEVLRAATEATCYFFLTLLGNSSKLVKKLSWDHRASTPHRSETDGIAERAVRRVKEGT